MDERTRANVGGQSASATRTDVNVNCTLYIASIQQEYQLHKLQIDPKM